MKKKKRKSQLKRIKKEDKNTEKPNNVPVAVATSPKREITEELRESYLDYAMSVIVSRALPDVRDGLKPVQRRILWAMWDSGLSHAAKLKKSANVVGEVLGKYHPHSDIAVYDALARMAQDFSLRYPLINGQGNWGCFTGDTKISLTDGRNINFIDLVKEFQSGKKNYTFTFDHQTKSVEIAEIKNPRLTKKNAELVEVVLDNGEKIKCTPNHRFMLRDGTYKEAQFFRRGDSLMPVYFRLSTQEDDKNAIGYRMIWQPVKNVWDWVHRLADKSNIKKGVYKKNTGRIRHHLNFNKLNNNPDNIKRMDWKKHWILHYKLASQRHKEDSEYVRKLAEGRQKYINQNRHVFSERARKQWDDPEFRKKVSEGTRKRNLKRLKEQPDFLKKLAKRSALSLRKKWQRPEYKKQVIKSKILRHVKNLLDQGYKNISPNIYEKNRINNGVPGIGNTLKYFSDFKKITQQAQKYNHKIIGIRFLEEKEDVFDLTINRTHNFALAAGIFVHNSIDGDSPAAMRYCVTGDTLVVTEKGLAPIAEISEGKKEAEKDIALNILSKDRLVNKASRWFDSGEHPTIKIQTNRGFALQGSSNHPILIWTKNPITDEPGFRWKLLSEIQEGDIAVIDRTADLLWPTENVALKKYQPNHEGRRTEKKVLPEILDENLAYLLGALVAEGTIKKNDIEFCNSDFDWIRDFERKWQLVFPDCRLHKFLKKPSSFGKKPYATLEIHSRYVVEFLKNVGLTPDKSSAKKIPALIMKSPQKVVAAFLRAYFEGDGSISYSGKMTELSAISTSEELIKQLQVILLRFGIAAAKRFDKYRKTHKLYIRGLKNYRLFQEKIGFISTAKIEKLRQAVERLQKDYSATDFIPFVQEFTRSVLQTKYADKKYSIKHNFDRYSNLANNYQTVATTVRPLLKIRIKTLFEYLLENNYLFDPIAKVEAGEIKRVYSLRVNSPCHSFIANGFINHNTECRLSKISEELLTDIEKETVDWQPNYDASRQEPKVLPAKIPNLLLNGTMGIAVGMATNIPPHNLGEIVDAVIHLIDKPKADAEDLMKYVQGPDFPTGGIIYDKKAIDEAYATGKGSVTTRAVAEIKETDKNRHYIEITEIPYEVNKAELIIKIAELITAKKIQGVRDVRDESDKDGLSIVIELKQDVPPQKILNQLYKFTDLQKDFHLNMVALVGGLQPQVLSLKEILLAYIEHRREVVKRRAEFDLKKAEERAHILLGLHKALGIIDRVIKTIKKSADRDAAHKNLIKKFKFTDPQATAILEMKLQTLASLERKKIDDELKEKKKLIDSLKSLLESHAKIMGTVKDELKEMKEKYGGERKTKVVASGLKEFKEEDLIPKEETIITMSHSGYIKRVPPSSFKVQKRGGKGLIGSDVGEEDFLSHLISANTHDNILFFTERGRGFQTKVYEIPEASRVARGKSIYNFLEIPTEEKITAIITYPSEKKSIPGFLVMVTKNGMIKKTALQDFGNVRRSGIIAIKLRKGDLLQWVTLSSGKDEIILTTGQGQAIHFKESLLRSMGRATSGVRGIRLRKNDEVVSLNIVDETNKNGALLTVMANGFGKQTKLNQYKIQGRGGSGIKTAQVTAKTGPVVASRIINDQKELLVLSAQGQIIRTSLANVRLAGRATQGVRIMNLNPKDKISALICL